MQSKSKKITIDDLAVMVAQGFENTASKADAEILKTDVSDIKLRLDYMAPKFEVRDLEKRVRRFRRQSWN